MEIRKLDSVLAVARAFLGGSPDEDEAAFRLHDILVEEVSIVDRAANRRRFLVVKQRGGSVDNINKAEEVGQPATSPEGSSAEGSGSAGMPSTVKEGILRILTEVLERTVSVANMVKDSEETTAASDAPLDNALGVEIKAIADLLGSVISRYPSPVAKAEGVVATTLAAIGEQALELSKQAAQEDSLASDCITKIRQLAIALNTLVEKYPSPTSGAEVAKVEENVMEETPVALEQKAEETQASPPDAPVVASLSALGTEFADKMKVLASVIQRIAEAPDPEALAALQVEMCGVTKALLPESANAEEPTAAQTLLVDQLTKVVEELKRRVDALTTTAEKRAMVDQPIPPAVESGVLPNVGVGPTGDDPASKGEGVLASVMKRLDALVSTVEKIASTPQIPASRPEGKPEANVDRRGVLKSPWIM